MSAKAASPGVLKLVLWVGRSNVLAAIASMVVGVITARLLGPVGRGNYALFVTTTTIVGSISIMGIYQAGIYYVSKGKITSSQGFGSVLMLVFASLLILPVIALIWTVLLGQNTYVFRGFWVISAFILACTFPILRDGCGGIAMARKEYQIYTNQLIVEPLLILAMTLFLFVSVRNETVAVMLRVAGSGLAILFLGWQMWRLLPIKPSFDLRVLRDEVLFGIQAVAQSTLMMLNFRIYLYFLAAVSAKAAGWYSIALLFCELVRFVPNAVGAALFPFLSSAETSDANRLAMISCRLMLATGLAIALGFAVLGDKLVLWVFGAAFLPAAFASKLMVFGAVIGILYQILGNYFASVGRQDIMIYASGGGLAVGLAAAAVLIPRFGIDGAGYAYVASSFAIGVVCAFWFARMTHLRPASFLILHREDFARFMALVGR